jgi:predicted amidohydrolase
MANNNLIILENGTIYDPYKNKKKAGSILIVDGIVKEVGKVPGSDNTRKIDCTG